MFRLLAKSLAIVLVCFSFQASVVAHAAGDGHGDTHAEAGHGGEHGGGEHAAELPMNWSQDLALFSLITFAVYVLVLRLGAWGPLQGGLNERERGIRQNIADAETSRLKSESLLKEHEIKLAKVQEEVREILAEARRDAEHTKQEIIATAQKEADATKHRAIAEIERSKDLALTELFDFVSTNVVNATEHMIGKSLSGADHERLVKEALAQVNVRRN
jgi:F-type H+-transporting ATPase subunit b